MLGISSDIGKDQLIQITGLPGSHVSMVNSCLYSGPTALNQPPSSATGIHNINTGSRSTTMARTIEMKPAVDGRLYDATTEHILMQEMNI